MYMTAPKSRKTPQQRRVAIMSHCERLNRYVFSLNAASDVICSRKAGKRLSLH